MQHRAAIDCHAHNWQSSPLAPFPGPWDVPVSVLKHEPVRARVPASSSPRQMHPRRLKPRRIQNPGSGLWKPKSCTPSSSSMQLDSRPVKVAALLGQLRASKCRSAPQTRPRHGNLLRPPHAKVEAEVSFSFADRLRASHCDLTSRG